MLMLFWSSFKFMGDFFTLYPQKSYVWILKMLQATLLRKCCIVPCTLQKIRSLLMVGEGTLAAVKPR